MTEIETIIKYTNKIALIDDFSTKSIEEILHDHIYIYTKVN